MIQDNPTSATGHDVVNEYVHAPVHHEDDFFSGLLKNTPEFLVTWEYVLMHPAGITYRTA